MQKSLRQTAKILGVSHSYLSQIKNGKRPMPQQLKERLEALDAYHSLTTGKQNNSAESGDESSLTPVITVVGDNGLEPMTSCV